MTKYHSLDSCNKCGGENDWDEVTTDGGHVSEANTKCNDCGFTDYWAYGFFESSQEMESKCATYEFKHC